MFQLRHPRPVQDAAAAPRREHKRYVPAAAFFVAQCGFGENGGGQVGRSRKPQFLQEPLQGGAQSSSETPSFHAARAIITIPMATALPWDT